MTGVSDLDRATHGLRFGDLWLVTGEPRSGRTTFAIQLARLLAEAGTPVQLRVGWDHLAYIGASIRAGHFGTDLGLTWLGEATMHPEEPVLDLPFDVHPHFSGLDLVPALRLLPSDGAVVIDDLDLHTTSDPLDFAWHASAWARDRNSRRVLVLTVPRHRVGSEDAERWQAWTRTCTVIVDVGAAGGSLRTLTVLSNRRGDTPVLEVAARFGAARMTDR